MKLILTISGLCLLACKSEDGNEYPQAPSKVDVFIPEAPRHTPRITFDPRDFRNINKHYSPAIVPDGSGGRLAAIDFSDGGLLELRVDKELPFNMTWGMNWEVPRYPEQEAWMRWVPTLKDLGFDPVYIPPDLLPEGAIVRLTLPGGEIKSHSVVKEDRDDNPDYVRWIFPAAGSMKKAVANEIVCTIDGIVSAALLDDGEQVMRADIDGPKEVRLSISNDLAKVPSNYNDEVKALDHVLHFDVMTTVTDPPFQPPMRDPEQRTAHPICNQVISVYTGKENPRNFSKRGSGGCHS